ncbi:hypothetical protein PHYSODRAFT_517714, partial [Phytophthora sojae]
KRKLARTGTKTVWVKCAGKTKTALPLHEDSKDSQYPPFVVFKVKPSKIEHRRQENTAVRHGFSMAMWKTGVSQAQQDYGMKMYANDKGKVSSYFRYICIDFKRFWDVENYTGWWNGPLTID